MTNTRADDHSVKRELDRLTAEFFRAVSFEAGATPAYQNIHTLFIENGLLIKNSGPGPEISSIPAFIEPRQASVDTGALTRFREAELTETTQIFGNVAHRFSAYEKSGTLNGVAFDARGMISTQFILTPAGWKMSAMAWDDERPGCPLRRHMEPRMPDITVYGAEASGSIAVEAALTLLGMRYTLIEGATWAEESARERVAPANPMRQIPTLVLADGEIMTESAAILIDLADRHPEAALAPSLTEPRRQQFLRWMVYVSSAIYSPHWIKPDVGRIGAPAELREAVVDAVHERIAFCWRNMDTQLTPGRYLLGDELTVLDLYVTVVSRFGPWRTRFYEAAPKMTPVVKRVDADPRLIGFWAARFQFDEGWD